MSTTVSYADTTITPAGVEGWEQTRSSRTLQHDYIGGGWDYTITPPGPRTGTLVYHFHDEAAAAACEQLHRDAPFLDLASDSREIVNGRYVLSDGGELDLTLTEASHWIVTVGYSEVVT